VTRPERNLASICSIKYIAFHSGCRLAACGNSVCLALHELWKIFHGCLSFENDLRQRLRFCVRDAQRNVLHAELRGNFRSFTA